MKLLNKVKCSKKGLKKKNYNNKYCKTNRSKNNFMFEKYIPLYVFKTF